MSSKSLNLQFYKLSSHKSLKLSIPVFYSSISSVSLP